MSDQHTPLPPNEGLVFASVERGQRGGCGWKLSCFAAPSTTRQQLAEAMDNAIEVVKRDEKMAAMFGGAEASA